MSDLTITERYILSLEQENKRLKSECCAYKKECNKDNCDCMYEEYEKMKEENVKLSNNVCEAIEYIQKNMKGEYIHTDYVYTMLGILKGQYTRATISPKLSKEAKEKIEKIELEEYMTCDFFNGVIEDVLRRIEKEKNESKH